jgi:mono/diheme cytochrome c family protein
VQYLRQDLVTFSLVGLTLVVGTVPYAIGAGNIAAGEKLYQARCSPCHGPDGKAATPTAQALNPKPRDHTDEAYMNQLSNEHLAKVTKNGGPAAGKSPIMPA